MGNFLAKHLGRQILYTSIALLAFALATLIVPMFFSMGPYESHRHDVFHAPSAKFFFGTDELGRDIFIRVMYGSRISLSTVAVSLILALPFGTALGISAGFFGGFWDALLMRVMDIWLSFPAFVMAIALAILMGPGTITAMLAIGIVSVPQFARVCRAKTLSVKEEAFVEAARAMGASNLYILLKTILPNIQSIIFVQAALTAGYAVLMEAALSFLGLGTNPPNPSWGIMLKKASIYLSDAPWYGILPGVFLTLLILLLNKLSDDMNAYYKI